jgi:Uma2 family endonuclease
MTIPTQIMSIEEFEVFAQDEANSNRHLEYIGGEVVEMVSNNRSSEIAGVILGELYIFLKTKKLGRLYGANGGFKVAGERYMPDLAFLSSKKQAEPSHQTWNDNAPDIAVEVLSPTDNPVKVSIKISNYLSVGSIVWLVDPDAKQVHIHRPGQAVSSLNVSDTLNEPILLPDFELKVETIFAE